MQCDCSSLGISPCGEQSVPAPSRPDAWSHGVSLLDCTILWIVLVQIIYYLINANFDLQCSSLSCLNQYIHTFVGQYCNTGKVTSTYGYSSGKCLRINGRYRIKMTAANNKGGN